LLVSNAEFEATRTGTILPKESAPKKAPKPATKSNNKQTAVPAAATPVAKGTSN
jgi:hypothetical protein